MRSVVVIPPIGSTFPLIVEVPHAGTAVPDDLRGELLLDQAGIQRDADLHVDRLYAEAPRLGATLIYTEVSRFIVDLNRDADDIDALSVNGHPSPRRDATRGLIWRLTTDGTPALAQPLSFAAYRSRVERYHAPYHQALDRVVRDLKQRFGGVLVLAGHSMPSVGKATHPDPGQQRADVVPGDLEGKACASVVMRAAVELFEKAGLKVAPNTPYKGGGTTQRLGRPGEHVHALQVELNRALYMNEETFAPDPRGFPRTKALCEELVRRLGEVALALLPTTR